jgi:hypothetical protein
MNLAIICQPAIFNLIRRWGFTSRAVSVIIALDMYFAGLIKENAQVMTGAEYLADELKKYRNICFYPSSGNDLSSLDYFASGRKPREERIICAESGNTRSPDPVCDSEDIDLFIHADINFYQEFAAGKDLEPEDCGMYGSFEVLSFRELPKIVNPNQIYDNYEFSGQVFEYKLRLWGSEKIRTLIYCLCENEFVVAKILLPKDVKVSTIWSKNWAGGYTHGTWLANVLDRLQTKKVFTDWLCVPGQRGEPRNLRVADKYPELMVPAKVRLVRNVDNHWIDEGANGWIEEFTVQKL